jgi:hypothetical protein
MYGDEVIDAFFASNEVMSQGFKHAFKTPSAARNNDNPV